MENSTGELTRWRIALIGLGVKPDDRVTICIERSVEMVVGRLGILKAGGGYVPLDPSYPSERLTYMSKDSRPMALVTQAALRERLAEVGMPVVVVDGKDDGSHLALQPQDSPDPVALGLNSRHLAYVIYTSGSTGMPKEVMVEHANASRLFAAAQEWLQFKASDVWTLFYSFAFDFRSGKCGERCSTGAAWWWCRGGVARSPQRLL